MSVTTKLIATSALALMLGGFTGVAHATDDGDASAALSSTHSASLGVNASADEDGVDAGTSTHARSTTSASADTDKGSAAALLDGGVDNDSAVALLDDNNGNSVGDAGGGFLNLGTEADDNTGANSGPIDLVNDTAGGVSSTVNGLLSKL